MCKSQEQGGLRCPSSAMSKLRSAQTELARAKERWGALMISPDTPSAALQQGNLRIQAATEKAHAEAVEFAATDAGREQLQRVLDNTPPGPEHEETTEILRLGADRRQEADRTYAQWRETHNEASPGRAGRVSASPGSGLGDRCPTCMQPAAPDHDCGSPNQPGTADPADTNPEACVSVPVPDPDDLTGMPIYEGPRSGVAGILDSGAFPAQDVDDNPVQIVVSEDELIAASDQAALRPNPAHADEMRAKAAEAAATSRRSWEQSDTDGFLSQRANDLTEQRYLAEARIAERGGVEVSALFDNDGNLVPAKLVDGKYGQSWGLLESDDPHGRITGYVNVSQAASPARRLKADTAKGYHEGTVRAPGRAVLRGEGNGMSGMTSVTVGEERSDGGFSRDVVVVLSTNDSADRVAATKPLDRMREAMPLRPSDSDPQADMWASAHSRAEYTALMQQQWHRRTMADSTRNASRQPGGAIRYTNATAAGDRVDTLAGDPAVQEYSADGTLLMAVRYRDGRIHDSADGEPSVTLYHPSGVMKRSAHRQNGQPGRRDGYGEVRVDYRPDGTVAGTLVQTDGQIRGARDDGYLWPCPNCGQRMGAGHDCADGQNVKVDSWHPNGAPARITAGSLYGDATEWTCDTEGNPTRSAEPTASTIT